MKTVQGFLTKADWTLNTAGALSSVAVAPIYELSPIAQTFARSRGEYQSQSYPGVRFHSFVNKDTTTDALFEPSSDLVEQIVRVVTVIQEYLQVTTAPISEVDLRLHVYAQLNSAVNSLTIGAIDDYVHQATGEVFPMTEWVSWTSLLEGGIVVKVWVNDESFKSQYSGTEIVSVALLDPIDRFFENHNAIVTELQQMSTQDKVVKLEHAAQDNPSTYQRFLNLKYVNRVNPSQHAWVDWGALIYGRMGDHIDTIKDSIVDQVLDKTSKTEAEWKLIFPGLFERTEFLFLPRWDILSTQNSTPLSSIYGSVLNLQESIAFAQAKLPEMDPDLISDRISVMPFDYKALMSLVLPGQSNPADIRVLQAIFPDYIPVNTSSPDFGRMSSKTRTWLLLMMDLILAAETMTEFSSVPQNVRRVYKDGIYYAAATYEQVSYLVASRQSLL